MTRRIVITGGGTGLGRAIADRFADEHPELVLVGRRQHVLDTAAEELRRDGTSTVSTYAADLSEPADVDRLAAELRRGPTVDVLVLNAGGTAAAGGDALSDVAAAWRAEFDSNVLTTVLLAHALQGHLTEPGARVVAISSLAGIRGSGAYGAAKAAVHAWMWSTATAYAARGITVNAVAPGFVPDTDFWRPRLAADPELWASRVAPIPAQRPGTPEEVAAAVAYLAAPDAGWTTGQILQVNGGTVLGRG